MQIEPEWWAESHESALITVGRYDYWCEVSTGPDDEWDWTVRMNGADKRPVKVASGIAGSLEAGKAAALAYLIGMSTCPRCTGSRP